MFAKNDEDLRRQIENVRQELTSALYLANEYDMKVIAQWEKAKLNGKLYPPYKRMNCFNNMINGVYTISLKGEVHRRNFTFICLDFISNAIGVEEGKIDRREIGQGYCFEIRVNTYLQLIFYMTCNELPICQMVTKEEIRKTSVYVCTE